ncbi:arginyl-tRNA--protein transferase 1 isoform X2 [Octopus sinensis]|uniref:Arginyl-tRNA--protein transferase 1 n=1 Tax=Octopus sinensis TaxID=2607531 RepID=A0A6P7TL07_9MOLL|nr:arginyl-tRNA--protein transferase 1 isoform X2 [Octopus sinensis]
MAEFSIVEYFAEHEKYHCGYCNSPDTNYSHGMWAHYLTVQDYQDLINRGWRRSGKYCYKPTMNQTCCPSYAVRCHAINFKISSSQKKVIKRVNRFLINGIRPQAAKKEEDEEGNNCMESDPGGSSQDLKETCSSSKPSATPKDSHPPKQMPKPGLGANPNKPLLRKAKVIRMEIKKQKLSQRENSQSKDTPTSNESSRGKLPSKNQNQPKTLEELLDEPAQQPNVAHKLEIKLVLTSPASTEFKYSYEDSYNIFKQYQMTIHKEKASSCTKRDFGDFLVNSPFEVHRDLPGGPPNGYGSFHQQYILDGKMIAVGVIDVLPNCLSSVYFYYDPEYSFLSLGTYSALREIALVRSLYKIQPNIEYYYMGYYIHSCPKMRYKGQYFPSTLLCPETYHWFPIEKCLPKLNEKKYCRFSDPDEVDENGNVDPNRVLILHEQQEMSFEMYHQLKPEANDENQVMEYANFVGKSCAQRMFLFRV